jgi:hypothetical protein
MNGGSLTRVTSKPLINGHWRAQTVVGCEFGHHDGAQGHDHAAGQIDAGRQDDQRLANRNGAYHHHLLQNQRKILQRQKVLVLKREKGTGQHQGNSRAQCSHWGEFGF